MPLWLPFRRLEKATVASTQSLAAEAQRIANAADPSNLSNAQTLGPGQAMPATPLDTTGRPRVWQYPTAWNLPTPPGQGRLAPYGVLKGAASQFDLLRKGIWIRTNEIVSLPWDITVKDRDRAENKERIKSLEPRIDAVKARFRRPDGRRTYQTWLRKLLEDHFVGDYMTLTTTRTLGGAVVGWRGIDGATIKPLLDVTGEIVGKPHVAYQQFLYGTPRFDFFDAADVMMDYKTALAAWYELDGGTHNPYADISPGELRYLPRNVRNDSAYGFSSVEAFLIFVNIALRHQLWEQSFWTDGNIPQLLAAAPDGWTADQIEEFQALWDAAHAGNQASQRSMVWVPGGSEIQQTDNALAHSVDFQNLIIDLVCVCMDVNRFELGLELKSQGQADAMVAQHQRVSLNPMADWLKNELFDPLIQDDLGEPDLEWVWPSLKAANAREQAEVNQILITSGQKSIDEVVAENGGRPPGIGRMLVTGAQILMERDLIEGTKHGIGSLTPGTSTFQAAQPRQGIEPGQHAGRARQPDNSAHGTTAPQAGGRKLAGSDDPAEAFKDIKRWRTKALKTGKWNVSFESAYIPPPMVDEIRQGLSEAKDAEAVRQLFAVYLEDEA